MQHKLDPAGSVHIVIILSGPRRGYSEALKNKIYHLVMDFDEALHFLGPDDERAQNPHAVLHRTGDDYEIKIPTDRHVWVNGQKVAENQLLKSGDLLEIDRGGTILRYRIYPAGVVPTKTVGMVMADSLNGASADAKSKLGKFSRFITNISWNFATQTTLWFRIWVLIILTILLISVVILMIQNLQLQRRVTFEDTRIEGIEERLKAEGANGLSQQDLLQLQSTVETQLEGTFKRLEELEAGSGKASQVIASATPSVVFLLGTFGLMEPETGRLFHYVESVDGLITKYTFEEEGKVMEMTLTGTAFVVSESGMLLTNRHVIEPWQGDPDLAMIQGRQLTPVILKIVAYYPGVSESVPVELVSIDESMDLALLQSTDNTPKITPLEFETSIPQPGDEVLLLGYPTGLRALVARASIEFIESITPNGPIESWTVAQRLSEAGSIKPLASRGIVSQVTDKFIVYDAETTFGGSGGPVLDLNGRVIAINAAIIPEFSGANMGVPARLAQDILAQIKK